TDKNSSIQIMLPSLRPSNSNAISQQTISRELDNQLKMSSSQSNYKLPLNSPCLLPNDSAKSLVSEIDAGVDDSKTTTNSSSTVLATCSNPTDKETQYNSLDLPIYVTSPRFSVMTGHLSNKQKETMVARIVKNRKIAMQKNEIDRNEQESAEKGKLRRRVTVSFSDGSKPGDSPALHVRTAYFRTI
ncbi:hypothetical protein HK096_001295, partial [Nowakowskiella sp. JEL0078]